MIRAFQYASMRDLLASDGERQWIDGRVVAVGMIEIEVNL